MRKSREHDGRGNIANNLACQSRDEHLTSGEQSLQRGNECVDVLEVADKDEEANKGRKRL